MGSYILTKLRAHRKKRLDDKDAVIQGLRENIDEYRHMLNILHIKIKMIHSKLKKHELLELFEDDEDIKSIFEISEEVWEKFE